MSVIKTEQKNSNKTLPNLNILINQFKNKSQYEKYLQQCQRKYQLKFYRVHTFSTIQVLQNYNSLKQKYEKGIYRVSAHTWYENERKLYIWYLICLIKYCGQKIFQNQSIWFQLSQCFFGKDIQLLKYYYTSMQKSPHRVQWTEEEDDALRQAFIKHNEGQWNQIAKQLFFKNISKQFKNPKHCRERWNNHLNDKIRKDPWNQQDDYELLNLIELHGKRWSQLGKIIIGRTQHQIKNRYNSLITRSDRKGTEQQTLKYLLSKYKGKMGKFKQEIKMQQKIKINQKQFGSMQDQYDYEEKREEKLIPTQSQIETEKIQYHNHNNHNNHNNEQGKKIIKQIKLNKNNCSKKSNQNKYKRYEQERNWMDQDDYGNENENEKQIDQEKYYQKQQHQNQNQKYQKEKQKQKQKIQKTYIINISMIDHRNQKNLQQDIKNKQEKEEKQKCQNFTFGGMSFIYTGRDKNILANNNITSSLEDKLLVSTSDFFRSSICGDIISQAPSIAHTPGYLFFEQKHHSEKGALKFRQQQKRSFEISEFSTSMQLLKAARLDLSEDLRHLSSSNLQAYKVKYSFSSEMKQIGS